jgi:hypothetical protein
MKIKLEQPMLIDSKEDVCFMIVEYVEIDPHTAANQISYYGKVYNYEEFIPKEGREGQWVYDLSLNVCLTKDKDGHWD